MIETMVADLLRIWPDPNFALTFLGFLHKLVCHWSLTLHSESPTRLAEFSFKHSKADSPTRRVGESFFSPNISANS